MQFVERLWRSWRIARTGAWIWALYKVPAFFRRALRRRSPKDTTHTHERAARTILAAAFDLRGVVIKACQAIATRADVFPPPFIEILKQCHDAVPPKPFPTIRDAVERELGKPLSPGFSGFEE